MTHETDFLRDRERMPETRWSRILAARDQQGDVRAHIDELIRSYWRVVYKYIRWNWHKPNEDAKDLTQEFFTRFLEKNYLRSVDQARGRFRTFLKASLEHFLRDRRDFDSAAKRASPKTTLSLDFIEAFDVATAQATFDQEWVRNLFELALARLEKQCEGEGKRIGADLFRALYLEPAGTPTYRELADRFAISESDVNNQLHAARASFKEIVRQLVHDSVSSMQDLEAELKELFGADGFQL